MTKRMVKEKGEGSWLGTALLAFVQKISGVFCLLHRFERNLRALEASRVEGLGALQALCGHSLADLHAHRGNLRALRVGFVRAGNVGLLRRLQGADQGLFLDGHLAELPAFLNFCLSFRRNTSMQRACQSFRRPARTSEERKINHLQGIARQSAVQRWVNRLKINPHG